MTDLFNKFCGTIPYDSQYVGTYQPIFGWVSRISKERERKKKDEFIKTINNKQSDEPSTPSNITTSQHATIHITPLESKPAGHDNKALDVNPKLHLSKESKEFKESKESKEFKEFITGGRVFAQSGLVLDIPVAKLKSVNIPLVYEMGRWFGEVKFADPDIKLLLSPIGILDIYLHYFFDFGSFLGPSIEHLWVAPGATTELIETYSQTDYRFQESETSFETIEEQESTLTDTNEFTEEMTNEKARDISAATSVQGGFNVKVWQVSGSASFKYNNSLKTSKSQIRKKMRELSTKVASEMRKKQRLLTRKSTEIRRESSRRHTIKNETDKLVSYELKRKFQKIGVQVKHVGSQLCWQTYIDEPGKLLGLAELIHVSSPDDFGKTPPPDDTEPSFPPEYVTVICNIRQIGINLGGNEDIYVRTNDPYYIWKNDRYRYKINGENKDIYVASNDNKKKPEDSNDVIIAEFEFDSPAPENTNYIFKVAKYNGVVTGTTGSAPNPWNVHCETKNDRGKFSVVLDQVDFKKNASVNIEVVCTWIAPVEYKEKIKDNKTNQKREYSRGLEREAQEHLYEALRERTNLVSKVQTRDSQDLRAEERTEIYRKLLNMLTGLEEVTEIENYYHLLSEKIRAIFDIEKMLYFVAQDWWRPNRSPQNNLIRPSVDIDNNKTITLNLENANRVQFGGVNTHRKENYWITESSDPAKYGSSLGWLLQLDGDKERNAFLNTPWVKTIIPIKPGREADAIEWLKQYFIEGYEGLDSPALNDDSSESNESVEKRLKRLANEIHQVNQIDKVFGAKQELYETGFSPLGDSTTILDGKPFEVFSQWVEIVPTRQVVPVTYEPSDQSQ